MPLSVLPGLAFAMDPTEEAPFSFDFLTLEPDADGFTGLVLDRSGRGRDALALGNVRIQDEGHSRSAVFHTNGRLRLDDAAWEVKPASSAMSVLAWVNIHKLSYLEVLRWQPVGEILLDLGDGPIVADRELVRDAVDVPFEAPVGVFPYVTKEGALHWSLHAADGTPIFTLDSLIGVGEWFHIAGTYDANAGGAALYLNGEQVASGSGTAELTRYTSGRDLVTINPAGYLSTWSLDDLNLWGRALSGDEVRSVMQFGPGLDNPTAVDDGAAVATWGSLKAR